MVHWIVSVSKVCNPPPVETPGDKMDGGVRNISTPLPLCLTQSLNKFQCVTIHYLLELETGVDNSRNLSSLPITPVVSQVPQGEKTTEVYPTAGLPLH